MPVYEFSSFRLEPDKRRLLQGTECVPLAAKAFDTLVVLVENRDRVVEKSDLLRVVWPDTVVEESNLSQNVFMLRKALGDSPDGARFIATIPKRGYRFVADVHVVPNGAARSEHETQPLPLARPATVVRRPLVAAVLAASAMVLATLSFWAGRRSAEETPPSLKRLTFRRGAVRTARFTADGRTIVYSASWDGQPSQVFLTRRESPESQPLGITGADVLSVSPSGMVAVLLRLPVLYAILGRYGTLAQVPITGGTPHELLDDVQDADWGPDGKTLAVVRRVDNSRKRLEYPIGRVLVETEPSGCVDSPRVSPRGGLVAYIDCRKDEGGPAISVADIQGRSRILYRSDRWLGGLAWSPEGDEVWFTAGAEGPFPEFRAVSLRGRMRRIARMPGTVADVSRQGDALVTFGSQRSGIVALAPGETREHDLSWFEGSIARGLSPDGGTVLFGEKLEGGGVNGRIYLRRTDGSPAVLVGEGSPLALSPDGKWALLREPRSRDLTLAPTGTGEARRLATGGINAYWAGWAGEDRIVLGGFAPGRVSGRLWVMDLSGGALRPLTAEQTGLGAPSPDGRWIFTVGHDGYFLYPLDGGERRPAVGVQKDEWPVGWTADSREVFVRRIGSLPVPIVRVDPATGRRQSVRALAPADGAGVTWLDPIVTPDGRGYVYTYYRSLTDLYLVDGLR
jgi:DNA-binding winged helix-turn-helix (wHTH) protein